MATFFRSITRAGPSRLPILSRPFTAPSTPSLQPQGEPTQAQPPAFSSERPPNPYSLNSSTKLPIPGGSSSLYIPESPTPAVQAQQADPDNWWAHQSRTFLSAGTGLKEALPGTPFSGRSIRVYSGDVVGAIRRLNGMLGRTGVKKHVRRGEYYEMPSEKRRRVASERHRRRFQEMVREKVQTVQMIRNRG